MKEVCKKIYFSLIIGLSLFCLQTVPIFSLPTTFSPSIIINDSDFYELPSMFTGRSREQSIQIIQKILSSQGSLLADKTFVISFGGAEWDSFVANKTGAGPYIGKTVSAAELIWMITRENLGNGSWANEPINETTNPLILLSAIQKESGIIYGNCSKEECYGQSVEYRTQRATGYYCYDNTPCDPDFLGFFKQAYFYNRINKAYIQGCGVGFETWNNGSYKWILPKKLGNTVTIDGQSVLLSTKFACSSYIFTPHLVHGTFFSVIKEIYQLSEQISSTITPDGGQVSSVTSNNSSTTPPIVIIEQPYVPPVKAQEDVIKTKDILIEPEVKKIIVKRRPVLEELPKNQNRLVENALQERAVKLEAIEPIIKNSSVSSLLTIKKSEENTPLSTILIASTGGVLVVFTILHKFLLWRDNKKWLSPR